MWKLLLDIVLTFMQIGVLSFGGGYAAVSLVEKQVVDVKGWMTYAEFADIVTIDELTPGPVAVNAATFVGTKMAGLPGAIAATIGAILPSCIIALILVKLYYRYRDMSIMNGALKGLKSMVVALIAVTTISILMNALFTAEIISFSSLDVVSVILFIVSMILLRKYKMNPLIVMAICGVVGLIVYPFI